MVEPIVGPRSGRQEGDRNAAGNQGGVGHGGQTTHEKAGVEAPTGGPVALNQYQEGSREVPEPMVPRTLTRHTPPTTREAVGRASTSMVQDALGDELEEVLGHPERPKRILGKVNFMACRNQDGDWAMFEAEGDAPAAEGMNKALEYLREQIKVCSLTCSCSLHQSSISQS